MLPKSPLAKIAAIVSVVAIGIGSWLGGYNGIGLVGTVLSAAGFILSAFVLEEVRELGPRFRRQLIRNQCLEDLKSNVKNLRPLRVAGAPSRLLGELHQAKVILQKLHGLETSDIRVQWKIEALDEVPGVGDPDLPTFAKNIAGELDGRIKQLELICRESEYGANDH